VELAEGRLLFKSNDKNNREIQGSLHYGGKSAAFGQDDVR
jgi:hypothetical protein